MIQAVRAGNKNLDVYVPRRTENSCCAPRKKKGCGKRGCQQKKREVRELDGLANVFVKDAKILVSKGNHDEKELSITASFRGREEKYDLHRL